MQDKDWEDGGWMRTLGMFMNGTASEIRDDHGQCAEDTDFLLLLNAHHEPVPFRISFELYHGGWKVAFDTSRPDVERRTRNRWGAIAWSNWRPDPWCCSVMSANWIATYRLQLHAGFPLGAAQRFCRIWPNWESAMCTCRRAFRQCPAASMDMTSRTPLGSATILAARPPGRASSSAPARTVSGSCSTSCRITCRRRSTIRGGTMCLRMDRSASSPSSSISETRATEPFLRAFVLSRAALWRGAGCAAN